MEFDGHVDEDNHDLGSVQQKSRSSTIIGDGTPPTAPRTPADRKDKKIMSASERRDDASSPSKPKGTTNRLETAAKDASVSAPDSPPTPAALTLTFTLSPETRRMLAELLRLLLTLSIRLIAWTLLGVSKTVIALEGIARAEVGKCTPIGAVGEGAESANIGAGSKSGGGSVIAGSGSPDKARR